MIGGHYLMERILVVEDDSFFREVFCDLLTEEGYAVDVTSCGEEALIKLAEHEYHIVVTDLVMQGINGLDILARVKQKDPAIEVIMVTGHANMETAIFALKNGARDYLVKPINHDEFKHTVSLCLEQRRLLDENQELKVQISLYQVSQTIANCLDLERLNSLVIDALAKEVGVNRGLAFYMDGIDTLILKELRGFSEQDGAKLGDALIKIAAAPVEQAVTTLPSHVVKSLHDLCGDTITDIRDGLILCIRSKSQLLGIVALFNDSGENLPTDVNMKSIHFLLDQSSLAFENASHYTTAKNLLYIDELTGLFNYRYLEVALERELRRAERYGSNLSVIFLDLDDFKKINDSYGHLIGSKILREVGKLLKKSVREVDTVMRYGGDEYTIILIETGMTDASTVAERIRKSIASNMFLAEDGLKIRISASLGYACYPDDTKSKIELLEFADRAMYHGKTKGKNIVFPISAYNVT
jgi:diguanylate cyclase (GGDEF)-like protein